MSVQTGYSLYQTSKVIGMQGDANPSRVDNTIMGAAGLSFGDFVTFDSKGHSIGLADLIGKLASPVQIAGVLKRHLNLAKPAVPENNHGDNTYLMKLGETHPLVRMGSINVKVNMDVGGVSGYRKGNPVYVGIGPNYGSVADFLNSAKPKVDANWKLLSSATFRDSEEGSGFGIATIYIDAANFPVLIDGVGAVK